MNEAFLKKNNFSEFRKEKYHSVLESTRTSLETKLSTINQTEFLNYLKIFSGKEIPDNKLKIYILIFSKPLSFQLSGFAIGWASETDYWSWLLAHELLHKFNPSEENINHLMKLADSDTFYHEAYKRIYDEFDEGLEEEFVDAGARYIIHKLGIMSYIRNLRSIKFMYRSERTGEAGMPVTGILFKALVDGKPIDNDFNYNEFIKTILRDILAEGEGIEKRYQEVLKPVSGTIGMILKSHEKGAMVDRIFPNYPAEQSGIMVGDIISHVENTDMTGKELEDILDMLLNFFIWL